MKVGSGQSLMAYDLVEVNYQGKLIDGTKFDSSFDRGKLSSFHLTQVIPGWTERLNLMIEGGKFDKVYSNRFNR